MIIETIVIALGALAIWTLLRDILPDWIWTHTSAVLLLGIAAGDYFAPVWVKIALAAVGLVGLVNFTQQRVNVTTIQRRSR